MKSLITLVSLLSLLITNLSFGGIQTSTGFESEYIYRGDKIASNVATTAVALDYNNYYINALGIWNIEDEVSSNKIDLAGGVIIDLPLSDLDVGLNVYLYPDNTNGETEYTYEPYVGINFELPFSPSAYLYYDVKLEQFTGEATLSNTLLVESYEWLQVVPSVYIGYVDAGDLLPNTAGEEANGYMYYGGALDAQIEIADTVTLSVGVRYADTNDFAVEEANFSWGTALNISF